MAIRLYFPNSAAPGVSPPFDINPNPGCHSWTNTSVATRHKLGLSKTWGGWFTHTAPGYKEAGAGNTWLVRQYVSPPLKAQTINSGGTIKAQIRASENNTAANYFPYMSVRLFSGDGQTLRTGDATFSCLTQNSPGVEFKGYACNSSFATAAYNEIPDTFHAQDGDILVVEIGIYIGTTGDYTGSIYFGDSSGSDLPENETSTSQYSPWIEFSQDLQFKTTRFYFPSDKASPVSPALFPDIYDNDVYWLWDPTYTRTDCTVRRAMTLEKTDSAFEVQSVTKNNTIAVGEFELFRQYISPPLAQDVTIEGGFYCFVRVKQNLPWAQALTGPYVSLRVVSGDCQTLRGSLFQGGGSAGAAMTTNLTNFDYAVGGYFPDAAPFDNPVACQTGDRIILEIGSINYCRPDDTPPCDVTTYSMEWGDSSTTDLPIDETTQLQYNPWLQINQALSFSEDVGGGGDEEESVIVLTRDWPPPNPKTDNFWQSQPGKRKFPL